MDNVFNGKRCDVLHTGYLNKDISFGDIVYLSTTDNIFNGLLYDILYTGYLNPPMAGGGCPPPTGFFSFSREWEELFPN